MNNFFIDEWAEALSKTDEVVVKVNGYKPKKKNNIYKTKAKSLYSIVFEDKSVYVGVTYCLERRKYEHLKNSNNRNVREKIQSVPFKFIEGEVLKSSKEAHKEQDLIRKYRKLGYEILNIAKGGIIHSFCASE